MDRTSRDLFPGALEMMVLRSLQRQPLHGYALVQHIKRSSKDLLQIEEGLALSGAAADAQGRLGQGAAGVCPRLAGGSVTYELTTPGPPPPARRDVAVRAHARRHSTRARRGTGMTWLRRLVDDGSWSAIWRTRSMRTSPSEPTSSWRRDCRVRRRIARARREFGNVTAIEERGREVWRWATLENLWSDLRYGARQFRGAPPSRWPRC